MLQQGEVLQIYRRNLPLLEQADRMGRNPLQRSGEAKTLLGGGLDADLPHGTAADSSNTAAHTVDVGGQLRLLGHDGDCLLYTSIAALGKLDQTAVQPLDNDLSLIHI